MLKPCGVIILGMGLSGAVFGQSEASNGTNCAALRNVYLDGADITTAELIPASEGKEVMIGNRQVQLHKKLPQFCRVAVNDRPSPDSDIKVEIWLPTAGWNGRLHGVGNGGFAGAIDYVSMAAEVSEGYAAVATDTGHAGGDGSFALGHPEKVKDYAWRGIHDMTVDAKTMINAFYGKPVSHSYFASCSNGGREALMEAQRFPEDYDGILAGDPANYFTQLVTMSMWVERAISLAPDSQIPPRKIPTIIGAVQTACDRLDGVSDGVLNDPQQCKFDPSTIVCKHGDADTCLLPAQAEILKKIYLGPQTAKGQQVFPGFVPGGEGEPFGMRLFVTGPVGGKGVLFLLGDGFFRHFIYQDRNWDYRKFDLDQGIKLANEKMGSLLNAVDPNLRPFTNRGGKLILYHGWNDWGIPAQTSIDYFESVLRTLGKEETEASLRFYLVPGMQHCGRGPGANDFGQDVTQPRGDAKHDVATALEEWVENDHVPSILTATKFVDDDRAKGVQFTRPLCAYPLYPEYKGTGDTSEAKDFQCVPKVK